MTHRPQLSRLLGLTLAALGGAAWSQDSGDPPVDATYFRTTIQPILEANCLRCHGGGERLRGGLRLTSRTALARGGDSGPAVDEANFDQSLLLLMVRWEDEQFQMPPSGRLPDDELRAFERWVQAGAPYDPELEVEGEDEEEEQGPSLSRHDDGLVGWAYRELSPSSMLSEADRPIDEFVNARLAAEGLQPNPAADRVTLIRRATFDLTGLPPTPAEVQAFVSDDSPDAWERLIDRLLASPRYGEKWGRYWLDLVRYAETNGFERDSDKPFIWRYRDWVIDSLNADKPFDRFTLEQLCGDELDDASPKTRTATGYYRLPQWDDEPPQGPLQARYDVLDDVARTTSEVFLGTTIGCARCHDHPADPISQEEYYSFVGFFDGLTDITVDGYVTTEMTEEELAEWSRQEAQRAARELALSTEVDRLETELRDRLVRHDGGQVPADLEDVRYRIYRSDALRAAAEDVFQPADFEGLEPTEEGRLDGGWIDLLAAHDGEEFGVIFEALLRVPADGEYQFRLATATAAKIQVDDRVVLAGGHNNLPSEPIHLRAGEIPLLVEYVHRTQWPYLRIAWRRVDSEPWLFTVDDPGEGWFESEFDASGWASGGPSFGEAHPHAKGVTPWSGDSIWLRHEFEWDEPGSALGLAAFHDDDLEVWINGVPALEREGYVTDYELHAISEEAQAAIVPGRNVLAVRCIQDFGGQFLHVRPVDLRDQAASHASDAVEGWRPLTRHDRKFASPAITDRLKARRAEVLEEAALAHFEATVAGLREVHGRNVPTKRAATAQERAEIGDLHVHVRGNPNVPGAKVEPRFPTEMTSAEPAWPTLPEGVQSSGRRRALAEWIVESPLFARVLANRLWQGHFGRGLVATSSDFGELGDRPTHPELLDWLAREARERNWSLKDLHRVVMTSETYRRSSDVNESALAQDPTNTTFWRFDRRRLQAEEVRDAMLATAGVLNEQRGGPPFFARVSEEELATSSTPHSVWGTSPKEETNRRSIYAKVKRSLRPATLANFDAADTDASCPVRFETVQPGQALGLLNGLFSREMATALAERVLAEASDGGLHGTIGRAIELALGRTATPSEVERLESLHAELVRDYELEPTAALADVCLVVFNLNEFLYLD